MNRGELQSLARARLLDAEALLSAGRWSGAYYLSGYAVECGLKACIAKLTREFDFPDKKLAADAFTHDNESLIVLARLKADLDATKAANSLFAVSWLIVKDWNEKARYEMWTEVASRKLYLAVADLKNGVLQWVTKHW